MNPSASVAVGSSYLTLGSIGITQQKNGTLNIDAKKLQSAVNANTDGVAKLFTNGGKGGKGVADKLVSKIQTLVGATGSIQREAAAVNKDITSLNTKKANLTKALTAQANALVKQYSQQNSAGTTGQNPTLLDMLG